MHISIILLSPAVTVAWALIALRAVVFMFEGFLSPDSKLLCVNSHLSLFLKQLALLLLKPLLSNNNHLHVSDLEFAHEQSFRREDSHTSVIAAIGHEI